MPPLPFWTMMTLHVFLIKTTVDTPIYNRMTTVARSTRPMMVSCAKDGMPIGSQKHMNGLMLDNIQMLVWTQTSAVILMVNFKLHDVLRWLWYQPTYSKYGVKFAKISKINSLAGPPTPTKHHGGSIAVSAPERVVHSATPTNQKQYRLPVSVRSLHLPSNYPKKLLVTFVTFA